MNKHLTDIVGPSGTVSGLYPTQTVAAYGTPLARTSTAVYDFYTGLVTSATDVDNGVTSATEYDALGRPTKSIAAAGTPLEIWTRTEYDDINRRVIVRSDLETKGDGKKVAIQHYDQLGRVRLSRTLENAAIEDPTNEQHGIKVQTRWAYHSGSPSASNGEYKLTSNPYRGATSGASSTEPTMGWTVEFESKSGNLQTVETFSSSGLPSLWGSSTTSTGKIEVTKNANATTTIDEAGKKRRTVTDALGRLIRVDEPDASGNLDSSTSATNYTHDALGNLTQIIQGGQTRTFTYSSLSRLLTSTNPESGTFQYTYDPNGNLLTKKDARNITTTYMYDALNRATFRDYSDSTPDITYTYDDPQVPFSKGKLTKVASSVSETHHLGFDAQDRITGSKQITDGQTYTFGYTYNLDDDLLTQTYPSGKVVEFDYDASGDIEQVSKQTANGLKVYANTFSYAPHGQIEKLRLGNGKWETTKFNSSRQITEIDLGHSATDTGLWKATYEYGEWNGTAIDPLKNNGSLARQTITVPTIGTATGFTAVQTYTYDTLDRVKSATEKVGETQTWKQTFNYDRFGNRRFDTANTTILSSESNVPKIADPEILQSNNKFKEDQDGDSQPDYLYDLSGNITKNAREQNFTYDSENRQIAATGNNLSMSYAYDGNGKRVKSHNAVNGQTTNFVYDAGGKLSAEYTIDVPAPTNPTISYLTEDALGSVRVTTNSFGEIKARRDFLPFGEELYAGLAGRNPNQKYSSGADDTRKKFATYQRDAETGLDFAQSRYYSPMHGRFTSPDEFKGGPDELFDFEEDASDNPTFYADLENPQSLNKYQYGYNNPYKYNDPSGHCSLGICVWGPPASRTADRVVNGVLRVAQATGVTAAATAALTAVDGAIRRGGIERDNTAAGRMAQATERRLLDNYDARQRQNQPQILMNAQVGGSAGDKPRGSRNPKVANAAAEGRKRHGQLKAKVQNKKGWKSEPKLTDPKTGKTVKPDVVTNSGRPLELKPNTPSGRRQGQRQLPAQERATGKKGRVMLSGDVPGRADKASRGLERLIQNDRRACHRRVEDGLETRLCETERDHSHGPRQPVCIERIQKPDRSMPLKTIDVGQRQLL